MRFFSFDIQCSGQSIVAAQSRISAGIKLKSIIQIGRYKTQIITAIDDTLYIVAVPQYRQMSVSHTTVKESHQSSGCAVLNLTAGGFLQEIYRRKLMFIVVLMIGFDHAEWKSYTILNEHRIQHELTPSIL